MNLAQIFLLDDKVAGETNGEPYHSDDTNNDPCDFTTRQFGFVVLSIVRIRNVRILICLVITRFFGVSARIFWIRILRVFRFSASFGSFTALLIEVILSLLAGLSGETKNAGVGELLIGARNTKQRIVVLALAAIEELVLIANSLRNLVNALLGYGCAGLSAFVNATILLVLHEQLVRITSKISAILVKIAGHCVIIRAGYR